MPVLTLVLSFTLTVPHTVAQPISGRTLGTLPSGRESCWVSDCSFSVQSQEVSGGRMCSPPPSHFPKHWAAVTEPWAKKSEFHFEMKKKQHFALLYSCFPTLDILGLITDFKRMCPILFYLSWHWRLNQNHLEGQGNLAPMVPGGRETASSLASFILRARVHLRATCSACPFTQPFRVPLGIKCDHEPVDCVLHY